MHWRKPRWQGFLKLNGHTPPADSFNAIVSGRFTLSFDPSMRVVAAGWYGEFGANPSLPAPTGDLALADISTLQLQANAAMQHASITVDQAAGLAVFEFEFDWGPAGMVPSLNVDSNGHTNIAALLLEAPAQPMADAVTVLGSPAQTAALGTESSTYMLCTSGYCGVNPVPEPQVWAMVMASLGVIGWRVRGRGKAA
ncbi:PEP-CTERM sorting domain-containing protein [Aquabacterium lacunae]|uniref:PEP-CTERM sorting domain-containing protein n=1 Tax=Aquabacterium lacunae TaxID=2528630 RepID=UPI00103341C6|nr:PEP-CTERM sorting domain-containing protein [Aquabacterium lacunae]